MTVRGRGYSKGEDTYGYPGEVMADKPTFWDVFTAIPGEVIKTITQPIEFGVETTEAVVEGMVEAAQKAASDVGNLVDTGGNGGDSGGDKPKPSNLFLPLVLGGFGAVAAAPLLYRAVAGKRGKDNAEAVRMVDNASNRAVSLIGAFAPLVALPMTYIAVDELENRRIISGPLGDSVQVLIGAMAGGQLVSGLATIAKAI